MTPRVGIVVPVGRYRLELETALKSLTLQDIPVSIAVYDASNDVRTKTLIQKFQKHIEFVHYGEDGGQANAIAMGWKKLDTEY